MKLLVLTPDIPYPLNMGGNVAQFGFTDYLRHKVSITYILEINNLDDEANVGVLEQLWANVQIIKVYGEGYGTGKKLSVYQRVFRKVSFIANRISTGSVTKRLFSNNQIYKNALWYLKPMSENFINAAWLHIKNEKPDLIQIEHSRALSLGELETGVIPKVFIHHEVQYGMLKSAQKNTGSSAYSDYTIRVTRNIESNLLKKFDHIITFSEDDKRQLVECGIKNVTAIPFPLLETSFKHVDQHDLSINKLIFIGGDWHHPNVDAVHWYFTDLGELIYKRFGFKLHVIGKWSQTNKNNFSCDFIKFDGFVNDLNDACRNSINILPIRVGAGLRTKLLSAMALSQPIITSSVGAEGVNIEDGQQAFFADSQQQFLDAIAKILASNEETTKMCRKAFNFVKTNYGQEGLANQRLARYKEILNDKQ